MCPELFVILSVFLFLGESVYAIKHLQWLVDVAKHGECSICAVLTSVTLSW